MKSNVRKPLLAGSWYPGSPQQLKRRIEEYAAQVSFSTESEEGELLAIVTPHAGLDYSGRIAATAWKFAAERSFEAVILIGPSHRVRFSGGFICNQAGYESPLGLLPVDNDLARRMIDYGDIISSASDEGVPENSIELQIPFLQVLLPGIPFVPVIMGNQDRKTCDAVASAIISAVGGRKVLIAASSDLSHYHSYEEAVAMDLATVDCLVKRDIDGLYRAVEKGLSEACGYGPIGVAMTVAEARGCDGARLLQYENSGDVTGERSNVVGYAAVAFMQSPAAGRGASETSEQARGLSGSERKALIALARESIESALAGRPPLKSASMTEKMKEPRGSFVTLKQRGRLRGCIGYIQPARPLHETVADAARAAALDDPRFPPLAPNDLNEVELEISVLSPLQAIKNISEIEPGRHGLYIIKGSRSGLLLPQVAQEHGWDRSTFLAETCRKAGLPPNVWQEKDAVVYIFSAEVFGENQ